jgi:hypothetical protein
MDSIHEAITFIHTVGILGSFGYSMHEHLPHSEMACPYGYRQQFISVIHSTALYFRYQHHRQRR